MSLEKKKKRQKGQTDKIHSLHSLGTHMEVEFFKVFNTSEHPRQPISAHKQSQYGRGSTLSQIGCGTFSVDINHLWISFILSVLIIIRHDFYQKLCEKKRKRISITK